MKAPGFTLPELMITIAIICILSGFSTLKIQDATRRSREAVTKANLAMLRTALSMYHLVYGIFPDQLEEIVTMPGSVLSEIPTVWTPPYHNRGNRVYSGSLEHMSEARPYAWHYFNCDLDKEYGTVIVNCTHPDIKGREWSTY